MVVGAHGANGAHALKRVALENNIAVATATSQHQRMEEKTVLVKRRSQGTAIQILAQVSLLRSATDCFLSGPLQLQLIKINYHYYAKKFNCIDVGISVQPPC